MNDFDQELDLLTPIDLPGLSDSTIGDELSANRNGERFVAFFLGGSLYGIRASDIAEVSHPVHITPLPSSPGMLLGIAPLRGEIVAVINLKQMVGETSENPSPKNKLVVLKESGRTGDSQIAFPVDKMHEIVVLGRDEVSPASSDSNGILAGRAMTSTAEMQIVDTARLAASLAAA